MPVIVQVVVTGSLGLAALAAPLSGLCAALLINVIFGAAAVLMWAQQYKQYGFSYSISGYHSLWIFIKRDSWTLGRGNTTWIRRERGNVIILYFVSLVYLNTFSRVQVLMSAHKHSSCIPDSNPETTITATTSPSAIR